MWLRLSQSYTPWENLRALRHSTVLYIILDVIPNDRHTSVHACVCLVWPYRHNGCDTEHRKALSTYVVPPGWIPINSSLASGFVSGTVAKMFCFPDGAGIYPRQLYPGYQSDLGRTRQFIFEEIPLKRHWSRLGQSSLEYRRALLYPMEWANGNRGCSQVSRGIFSVSSLSADGRSGK